MPANADQIRPTQPMTFRGPDGRVHKTEVMELNARAAAANSLEAREKTSWLVSLFRSPD